MEHYIFVSNKKNLDNGLADVSYGNIGDLSGYFILNYFANFFNYKNNICPINKSSPQFRSADKITFSVGSILDIAVLSHKKVNIIGSGSICDKLPKIHNKINFIGVRGKCTQDLILSQTGKKVSIIGDLGLLLSEINLERSSIKDKKIGFIIHSVDRPLFFQKFPNLKKFLINNYGNLNTFIKDLTSCEYIISSSLHGIIFSHAYGIPCLGVKITDNIIGDNFKYCDYYSSLNHHYLGRTNIDKLDFNNEFNLISSIKSGFNPELSLISSIKNNQINILKDFLTL